MYCRLHWRNIGLRRCPDSVAGTRLSDVCRIQATDGDPPLQGGDKPGVSPSR
jgi:hypothetical protein